VKKLCSLFSTNYFLPTKNRSFFKKPLGKLLKTDSEINSFFDFIKENNIENELISVGDATTKKLLENKIYPRLIIIDGQIERKETSIIEVNDYKIVDAINPPGEITLGACQKIRDALKLDSIKTIIKIDGEEDLLVLPVVFEVSTNSKVLYGQPKEGLVVVSVTEERKQFVKKLVEKYLVKKNGD